jgi:hypothetical protein
MPQASCPHCQALVSFTEEERGNIIPCSRCEQRFRLPAGKATPAARKPRQDNDWADDDHRRAPKKSGPNWLLLGLVGGGLIVLLCCGVGGLGIYYMAREVQKELEADEAEMQRAKAQAVAVTAEQLGDEFRTNLEAANQKYLGNYVRVQGVVDEIGKDEDDAPIVYLRAQGRRIACNFDDEDDKMARRARRLLKGQTVTILGQCVGQDGDIKLNDCELVD